MPRLGGLTAAAAVIREDDLGRLRLHVFVPSPLVIVVVVVEVVPTSTGAAGVAGRLTGVLIRDAIARGDQIPERPAGVRGTLRGDQVPV